MPLSELQAAQRRLAIALVLLSCPVNTASVAADLDTDVLTLLGDTLTEHCTLGPRQHLLCCQALKTLSNGWGRCRHVSPPPGFAARLERTISDFRKSNTNASKAARVCRVAKELRVASMDGGGTGVAVALREDGDIFSWEACIAGPPSSPYAGGLFFLDINLPADYPFNPPNIKFTTSIYHCNVKADGYITADSLDGGRWSPATTAWKALISIQALLSDPNPEDGCCDAIGRGELGDLCRNDRTKYDETARDWTRQHAVIIPGSV
jgi:ubiquitin-conjugating enzyme E2 D/E